MGHNLVPDPQNVQGTVTANKGTGWVDPQADALTDAQLRAAAVAVQDQHSSTGPLATEAKQLPDNHNVTVSNQINQPLEEGGSVTANKGTGWVDPQQDALTDTQLRAAPVETTDNEDGTWGYRAGVSGTPTIPANQKVLQVSASAGLSAASFTINGGDTITIPAGKNATFEPKGNLVSPTIVFTGTDAYFVEFVG